MSKIEEDIQLAKKARDLRRRVPLHLQWWRPRSHVLVSQGRHVEEATPEEIEWLKSYDAEHQQDSGLSLGDYFIHQRSGARFVVKAIIRRETGSALEIGPAASQEKGQP